ncbi:MAG: type III-B CRISPR module RAMP protein Cmr1 [Gemmataceae bacterium]
MFGGGVETRVNDPSFPIRPTAIRGQLQFWWRATVGAQYATRQELRAAQSDVWGDTTQASRVQVQVEVLKFDLPTACAKFERDYKDNTRYRSMPIWNAPFNNTALPYALFPFQGQLANGRRQIEVDPASCIHKAKFKLTVTCHKDIDFARQVEPALWAWVNFGGLVVYR